MKKYLAVLAAAGALSCFSVAQTQTQNAEEKQERASQKAQDNDANNPNGNITMVSGPSVSTNGNSANITWSTSGRAATIVHYGTDPNSLSQKSYQPGGAREHNVTLSNLQPNTTYYFAIMTDDNTVRTKGQFQTQASGTTALTPSGSTAVASGSSATSPINSSQIQKEPLFRLSSTSGHDHLYTTSSTEKTQAQSEGYKYEGIAGYISANQIAGTQPLYRLARKNGASTEHFYTSSQSEMQNAVQNLHFQSEGVIGYVPTSQIPGTVALERLVQPGTGEYLFTTSSAEKSSAVGQYKYQDQGVCCYLWPS